MYCRPVGRPRWSSDVNPLQFLLTPGQRHPSLTLWFFFFTSLFPSIRSCISNWETNSDASIDDLLMTWIMNWQPSGHRLWGSTTMLKIMVSNTPPPTHPKNFPFLSVVNINIFYLLSLTIKTVWLLLHWQGAFTVEMNQGTSEKCCLVMAGKSSTA